MRGRGRTRSASACTTPARITRFEPEIAITWVALTALNASRTAGLMRFSRPSRMPESSADCGSGSSWMMVWLRRVRKSSMAARSGLPVRSPVTSTVA